MLELSGSASVSATKSWTPLSRIVRVRRAGAAASVNTMSTSRRCATRTMASEANFEWRSEEHTSELQSLMRISYAVFCLKKKKTKTNHKKYTMNTQKTRYVTQIK